MKYFGLHLDQKLTWKTHVKAKRREVELKLKNTYWLMNKKSKLWIENKLTIYIQYLSQFGYTASIYGDATNHPTKKYSKHINQQLSG
jgi:hypothetical protein